jgi:P-type Cu+ transporter
MATVTCPVCLMRIESGEAAGQAEYGGQIYYFCSFGCRDLFNKNPKDYVKSS